MRRLRSTCVAVAALLVAATAVDAAVLNALTQVTVEANVRDDAYVSEMLTLQQSNRMGVPAPLPANCDGRLNSTVELNEMYAVANDNAALNNTATIERFAQAYGAQWTNFPKAEFIAHANGEAVPVTGGPPVNGGGGGGLPEPTIPSDVTLPDWATMPQSLPPGMTLPNGDPITMPGEMTLPPLPPMTIPDGFTLPGGETLPAATLPKTLPGGQPMPEPTIPKTLPGGQPMPEPTLPKTLPGGQPMPDPTMPTWPQTLPGGQPMPEPTIPKTLPFQTTLPPLPPGFPPNPFKKRLAAQRHEMRAKSGIAAATATQIWAARMQLLRHLVIWADWQTQFGADCVVTMNELTTQPATTSGRGIPVKPAGTETAQVVTASAAPITAVPAQTTRPPPPPPTTMAPFTAKVNASFSEAAFKTKMVAYLQSQGVSGIAATDIQVTRSGDDVSFTFTGSAAGLATQKAEEMPESEQRSMGMTSMSAPNNGGGGGGGDDGPGLVVIVVPVVLGVLILGGVAVVLARRGGGGGQRSGGRAAMNHEHESHLDQPMMMSKPPGHHDAPPAARHENPMARRDMDLL